MTKMSETLTETQLERITSGEVDLYVTVRGEVAAKVAGKSEGIGRSPRLAVEAVSRRS